MLDVKYNQSAGRFHVPALCSMLIEVYILRERTNTNTLLLYREVPAGAVADPYSRPPDYVFNVKFKQGYQLSDSYSVNWYLLRYEPKK